MTDGNVETDICLDQIEPIRDLRRDGDLKGIIAAMRAGAPFAPVWLWQIRHSQFPYRVCDGHHRVTAAKRLGRKTIRARILFDVHGVAEWRREQLAKKPRRPTKNPRRLGRGQV
jgi:hypothetical protein